MKNNLKIDYDLENSPLQIKTNSEVGSDEKVKVRYYDDKGGYAGGITLSFKSYPVYDLWTCSSNNGFPAELPTETDKIWTLSLTRTSSVKLVIHCNDKEVVKVVLSDTTCGDPSWSTYWSRDVGKIQFANANTAADYYRSGEDISSQEKRPIRQQSPKF